MTDNQNEPTAEINIEPPVSTDSSTSSTKDKGDAEEGALPFPLSSTSELMDIKNVADGMVEYETKVDLFSITRFQLVYNLPQEIEAELDKNEKQQQAEDPFQSQR